MKDVGVAILAGGTSKRLGTQKALVEFRGKPLIAYVLEVAMSLSSEVIVVVSEETQIDDLRDHIGDVKFHYDPEDSTRCALTGAITAFEFAPRKHTQLLPVDAPFVRPDVLRFLGQMAPGHGAVVPSWPNGYLEPLHAVYNSEHAYAVGLEVMEQGRRRMSDMLGGLRNVLYVSTEALKKLDSSLETFTNINSLQDLKKQERG